MLQFSKVSPNNNLKQIVDNALCSLASPRYELSVETTLTIPIPLQDIMCQSGLVLLSGRPCMGCTSLALNIALSITKFQRRTVLYFSFDTTKEMLMQKLLCIEGFVNIRRIWDREFEDTDWIQLNTAGNLIKELPLYIYDDPLLTVREIDQICRQHKYIDLVIIDSISNIHRIPGESGTSKRTTKENYILQQFSRLSKKHNTCVLCINTLEHGIEKRKCMEPDMCDIRKYRNSFDYIDSALFLYREDYYTPPKDPEKIQAYCNVRLCRNNDYRRIRMRWIPEYTTFLDIPYDNTV